MNERQTAAADALGSTRAEGLEPHKETLMLVERWARGEISSADLQEVRHLMVKAATVTPPTVSD